MTVSSAERCQKNIAPTRAVPNEDAASVAPVVPGRSNCIDTRRRSGCVANGSCSWPRNPRAGRAAKPGTHDAGGGHAGRIKPPGTRRTGACRPDGLERAIESERWSAREQELRESIGQHIENIADTRQGRRSACRVRSQCRRRRCSESQRRSSFWAKCSPKQTPRSRARSPARIG